MSYKIENDIILHYIKKGNTYFDILIYNSCNFKKNNEEKIIVYMDKDKLNNALDDIVEVYNNLFSFGLTLSGYQFIGLTLERNLQETATIDVRIGYFILCLGFLISMFGALLSFIVVEYIKGLRDETPEFVIVGIKGYKIIFKLADIILYGDSILFVVPINILVYNVIDFYFGVIFNVTSLVIFILGMYFHYKIIISRQIYHAQITKNECFESDIFGQIYNYYNKIETEAVIETTTANETATETESEPLVIQRRINLPIEFTDD
tara:strand:- start:58 stop:849 length:792 start_codon:yes stop_codon:yes gene_type:complete